MPALPDWRVVSGRESELEFANYSRDVEGTHIQIVVDSYSDPPWMKAQKLRDPVTADEFRRTNPYVGPFARRLRGVGGQRVLCARGWPSLLWSLPGYRTNATVEVAAHWLSDGRMWQFSDKRGLESVSLLVSHRVGTRTSSAAVEVGERAWQAVLQSFRSLAEPRE